MLPPFYVTEGTPYRPKLMLWLEMPSGVVVSSMLIDPEGETPSFGASLLEAMASPLIGPPRRPAAVRVADARLAGEVRRVLPEARVVVAPTPELDEVLRLLAEAAAQDAPGQEAGREAASYFEGGRVGAEAIAGLFRAATLLYDLAPWQAAGDHQILRLDIPAYDVEGACLSIIGALGESLGLILFSSLEGFEHFAEIAAVPRAPGQPIDMGGPILVLNYDAGAELPPTMLREALAHGWPVADAGAYPVVEHRDPDGFLRPLTERDVRVMTACATSLCTFFVKHGHRFERDEIDEAICESYFDGEDVEVRLTLPYEAGELFDVNRPRSAAGRHAAAAGGRAVAKPSKVGRNQPCPCGSGRKYKHCCLVRPSVAAGEPGESSLPPGDESSPSAIHDLDRRLVDRLVRHASDRFGPDWIAAAAGAFRDPTMREGLLDPWALYHHLYKDRTIVRHFLADRAASLSGAERSWLEAQAAAWLSIWEVAEVAPGRSLTLHDLLTDERRVVRETTASRTLVKRHALLARVIDHQGESVLCGLSPRALAPWDAAAVVQRARGRLRRKRSVPVERLRDPAIGRYLIKRWEEAVEGADARAGQLPELRNTDGDPLLITVDHFAFDYSDRVGIRRLLAAAEEAPDPPAADDPAPVYVFTRLRDPMDPRSQRTVTGTVAVSRREIRAESNSIRRADALRARLELLLGNRIRHRAREHADPMAVLQGDDPQAKAPPTPPPPDEVNQALLELKAKHFREWIDLPVPALDGLTPRDAVRTADGRRRVDDLLKEAEHAEACLPAGQRFDFTPIRWLLGLEE